MSCFAVTKFIINDRPLEAVHVPRGKCGLLLLSSLFSSPPTAISVHFRRASYPAAIKEAHFRPIRLVQATQSAANGRERARERELAWRLTVNVTLHCESNILSLLATRCLTGSISLVDTLIVPFFVVVCTFVWSRRGTEQA